MKVVLQNLTKRFPNRNKHVKEDVIAVNDFTVEVPDGILVGLLGPPGCGKSTIGAAIAEITGRKLTDTDTLIEEMTGKHPSAIIREMGEPEFRRIETEAVKQASKMSGVIIACGGGVVTRAENIPLLRQNGKIFYLDCPTDELALTPDRPLSQSLKALNSLYAVRAPLYHEAADSVIPISHRESPLTAANKIMNTFTELI